VFLVSHDRTFMDNVVTSTLAFEGDGLWREYEGSVQDWLVQSKRSREIAAQRANAASAAVTSAEKKNETEALPPQNNGTPLLKKKLSYKEQRELDALPARIEALEAEQADIQRALADGSLYSSDAARAAQLLQRNQVIEEELMESIERWTALAA